MLFVNDSLRGLIRSLMPMASAASARQMRGRLRRYVSAQDALADGYGIDSTTPIAGYDERLEAWVDQMREADPSMRVAYTSGSTSTPKKLAFPPSRLRLFQAESRAAGIRAFHHYGLVNAGLFVLASLKDDDSFSSLVLNARHATPGYLSGLIEPSRYLRDPRLAPYVRRYGSTAARFWLMTLSDPGAIYSTNPSTLSVFLTELHEAWDDSRAMVRACLHEPEMRRALRGVIRRVGRRGYLKRWRCVDGAPVPPPMDSVLPSLNGYVCWDGGYVGSFVDEIRTYLPPDRFIHVPMYSMSTETVATLPVPHADGCAFLPISPKVFYEFLPEGCPDDAALLKRAHQLEAGSCYTMVVSDPWGLRRYQTKDVFACVGLVAGLPDLRFLRRRGLTYSFTGEKLTAEHIAEAYQRVLDRLGSAGGTTLKFTCLPSRSEGSLPRYRWVLAYSSLQAPETLFAHTLKRDRDGELVSPALAALFDEELSAINEEYASKRSSRRLDAAACHVMHYDRLAAALDTKTQTREDVRQRSWESQFKLMPLTCRLWEKVDFSTSGRGGP